MVGTEERIKICIFCRREMPLSQFHKTGHGGGTTSRCKACHGIAVRRCHVCQQLFIVKAGRKTCSELCNELLRAPTYFNCKHCFRLFGPVDHLARKFCSSTCKHAAQATGRKTFRTTKKARSAQSLLRYHVQAGHILRPSICEECGASGRQIEGAHFNYDEPLRVRWLCVPCHRRWDKREPKQATYVVSKGKC